MMKKKKFPSFSQPRVALVGVIKGLFLSLTLSQFLSLSLSLSVSLSRSLSLSLSLAPSLSLALSLSLSLALRASRCGSIGSSSQNQTRKYSLSVLIKKKVVFFKKEVLFLE